MPQPATGRLREVPDDRRAFRLRAPFSLPGQIRDGKVTGGIELLDELARDPVFKGKEFSRRQWNSAVDFALQRDHAAVDRWLEENPDSPIHAQVLEMAERKKAAQAAKAPPTPD